MPDTLPLARDGRVGGFQIGAFGTAREGYALRSSTTITVAQSASKQDAALQIVPIVPSINSAWAIVLATVAQASAVCPAHHERKRR